MSFHVISCHFISFIHSFIHSIHSFIAFLYFIHSFIHSVTHSFIHSLTHSFIPSFIHSFISFNVISCHFISFLHSFNSFIHFIHSFHSYTPCIRFMHSTTLDWKCIHDTDSICSVQYTSDIKYMLVVYKHNSNSKKLGCQDCFPWFIQVDCWESVVAFERSLRRMRTLPTCDEDLREALRCCNEPLQVKLFH